ncbi:MAG: DUF6600 domain-containing protein [Chthoniobacterales bacterium]
MKRCFVFPLCAALALFVSCQKQQTEEERKAEVEREVQARIAAEHDAQQQQQLALQQADIDKREKAVGEREEAAEQKTTNPATRVRERSETTETRSNASYGTFYEKLEPYGAWFETDDYGYVWQPNAAGESRAWRPYTDGHWVYTDAGWTWISDEPFGWATYHYGRWVRLRDVGWAWVPGDEWAPAWVSWRTGGDYVGWAPLPPEARFDRRRGIHNWADNYYDIGPEQYAFVRAEEVGAPRLARQVVPPQQNVAIINQTTNVTNITYSNTTIVNQGPNYDELRSRSQQPIGRYRLERETTVVDRPEPVVRGEVIAMPGPVLAPAAGYDRPRSVRQHIAQSRADNGWSGISDRAAADQARAKMRSEATPPADAPPKTVAKAAPASAAPTATAAPSASPVATATPRTAPLPSVTPASEGSATMSPAATMTPHPRFTPRATATASPTESATAAPVATTTTTATATPAATARPQRTASPSATRFSSPPTVPRSPRVPTPGPSVSAEPANSPLATTTPAAPASASAAAPAAGAVDFSTRGAKARDQELKREFENARKTRELEQRGAGQRPHGFSPAPALTPPAAVPPAPAAQQQPAPGVSPSVSVDPNAAAPPAAQAAQPGRGHGGRRGAMPATAATPEPAASATPSP